MANTVFEAMFMLIGFGSVLFLAFVTTRYIAAKSNGNLRGKHLRIIETISLGLDKKICLIKAGAKYILVSISGKNTEYLCEVDIKEDISSENEEKRKAFNFRNIFDKYIDLQNRKNLKKYDAGIEGNEEGETFKDNLAKLKKITFGIDHKSIEDEDETVNEE